ncbi:MAG TPA: DUF72 domain-containing protein [Alphaproteobacteria bacterium]|nr:DUF72 domain-containing protein [Alphaproteobacteria bacterium]
MSQIRIGTAGWNVPAPYAESFPAEGTHLERYAQRMNAAEINSSFYKPHQSKTYARWAVSVPADFRFAVKAPKALTHEKRLKDGDELIAAFADQIAGLGEKLGVILVQLPPSLAFERQAAANAFAALADRIAAPIAVEPRHASWFVPEVEDWLAERRIARVAADPLPKNVPQSAAAPGGWDGLAYYRWHGSPRIYYSDYDAATLADLAARLAADAASGRAPWCIFDNTAAFAALGNALALAERLRSG